jgi:outer membrane lipoprotein-sorting protein
MDRKLFNKFGRVKTLFQKRVLLLLICFFIASLININAIAAYQPNTKEILTALHNRLDSLQDYQYQNIYIRNRNGTKTTEGYNYFFKKTNLIRLEVTDGKDKGSLAILTATGKVRARAGGVLSLFTVTLEPNDKRLQNEDGFTIADSGLQKIIKEIESRLIGNSSSRVVVVNSEKKLYQLQIDRDSFREKILIDMQTRLPIEWQTTQNGQFYAQIYWNNWQVNSGLPDSLFEL